DGGDFRVRARARQLAKAFWSDWREFKIAAKTPAACGASKPYGATYDAAATPATLYANQTTQVTIKLTHNGLIPWPMNGNFHLSFHWVLNGATVVFDGQRTVIPSDVPPCGTATVSAKLAVPANAGTYTLQWDLVQENVTWFSAQGVPTANKTVNVQVPPP